MTEYFTDPEGTIPAKPGEPVGCMKVIAGDGTVLVYEQRTASKRPTFTGGPIPHFDEIDDVLVLRAHS